MVDRGCGVRTTIQSDEVQIIHISLSIATLILSRCAVLKLEDVGSNPTGPANPTYGAVAQRKSVHLQTDTAY